MKVQPSDPDIMTDYMLTIVLVCVKTCVQIIYLFAILYSNFYFVGYEFIKIVKLYKYMIVNYYCLTRT